MLTGVAWIDEQQSDLIDLAQRIWELAEVGLREDRSAALQSAFLRQHGFSVTLGVAGMPSALVATWGEGAPVIGFLGKYDALPGLSQEPVPYQKPIREGGSGHGCGHNLLGVGSLAAAVALSRQLRAEGLGGTVRYYGCPAEETLIGKVFMAKHGLFKDLDAAISWHPAPLNSVWYSNYLAVNSVRFVFRGRPANAASDPQLGISALDAAELMNIGANYLREHMIPEARIHYVTLRGGTEPNIVPPYAEVWYYVRAPRRQDVEELYERLLKIAEGACLMTGAALEVKFQSGCYGYLPNPIVTDLLYQSLLEIGAPKFSEGEKDFAKELEKSFTTGQKEAVMKSFGAPPEYFDLSLHEEVVPPFEKGYTPGSTDVGDVSWITPTGQLYAACMVVGTLGHSWQKTACCGMSIGHKGMLVASKAMALAGYRLITRPELLEDAKKAFLKATGGKPYVSALPEDMMAPAQQLE
jgi:aminobenzoyl-glutamate utilization protein B